MGVENHAFMLALHDPGLVGVDPHDPNLSLEMIGRILKECKENPWYYFREVSRVPQDGSSIPVPLEGNRGNIALWWLFFNHATVFLIQVRQTGKSLASDSLNRYLLNVLCVDTSIHLLTKDDTLRRKNIEKLKELETVLPPYLRMTRRSDPNNGESIRIGALGNSYEAHVPQASEKGAYKVGRGLTSGIIQIDEFAYIPHLKATLTTMLSATNAAFKNAKRMGTPHGIILTSTAGKKDDRDGKFAYEQLQKALPFTDKLYDAKNEEDLYDIVTTNSTGETYSVNCTFNHRQVGKTDEDHRRDMVKAMIDGEDADRDYFNIWTTGTSGNPINADTLGVMRASERSDPHSEIDKVSRYITRWYIPENQIESLMQQGNIIVGIDTSDAIGRDEIALVYLDAISMEVVASGSYNETNLIEFAMWLFSVLVKYPKLVAIIERRSSGVAIIDFLLLKMAEAGINAFKRLYNRVVQDADTQPEVFDQIRYANRNEYARLFTQFKASFGFATSGGGETSRSNLYSTVLQNAAKHGADRMNDRTLINQIASLDSKNGRIDHGKDGHDDHVVAWLLGNWMVMYGRELSFYGLDTKLLMSSTRLKKSESELTWREKEQVGIRNKLETLIDDLAMTRDEHFMYRVENEIRHLSSKLVLGTDEIFNVTDLIKKAKESKRLSRNNDRHHSYAPPPPPRNQGWGQQSYRMH